MSTGWTQLSDELLIFYLVEQFRAWQASVRSLRRTHTDAATDFDALPEEVRVFIKSLVPIQLQLLAALPSGSLDGMRNAGKADTREGIASSLRALGADYHAAWVSMRVLFRAGRDNDSLPAFLKLREDDAPWEQISSAKQNEAIEIGWAWCRMYAAWPDETWFAFRAALVR